MKLVSICLLTYNHSKYIESALKGILNQTYPRVELVVLDDASNDGTTQIINKYRDEILQNVESLRIITHEENSGNVPHNCNEMITCSNGDYFMCVSGDDILLEEAAELLCNCLENNSDCLAVHANASIVDDGFSYESSRDGLMPRIRGGKSGTEKDFFSRLMINNYITAPTVMIKKSAYLDAGPHDENIPYEDYEYWLRLSQRGNFYFLNKIVALYRKSTASMTNYAVDSFSNKLKTAIYSDYLTREKYMSYLNDEDQKRSWKEYYERFIMYCSQFNCVDEMTRLIKESEEKGLSIDVNYLQIQERFSRIIREADILSKWVRVKRRGYIEDYYKQLGVSHIAIYGYSRLGNLLEKELEGTGVHLECYIDKKGSAIFNSKIPIKMPNESFDDIEAIFISPLDIKNEVCGVLSNRYEGKIIGIDEMIESLFLKSQIQGRE